MISLTKLAEVFENGLNTALGNSEIQFKIWGNAGEFREFQREGNTVTYFVNGSLRTSSSANDANDLVMGVNGLSLDFAVPVQQPRTNALQTSEELAKIKNEQYPFVQYVLNAINVYFQRAQSVIMTDDKQVEYSVSWQAGTAVSGEVDLLPALGNVMFVSVYIEVYFIEGGVNSKDVKVYFDGGSVPFKALRYGRTPVLQSEVNAGGLVSKNIITSTAFAVDVDFPVTNDPASKECVNYLLSGDPNVAHFVKVRFGNLSEETYFMTFNNVQTSMAGIAIAGASVSLIEIIANAQTMNVPKSFQAGRFTVGGSTVTEITFTSSVDCNAFIAGKAEYISGVQSIAITPADIEYDEETDNYYVYLITDRAVSVNSETPFEIVKEAENG